MSLGAENIRELLRRGLTTPAELFDAIEKVMVESLKKGPKLEKALGEIKRIRGLLKV
jgi:hypothetical protein